MPGFSNALGRGNGEIASDTQMLELAILRGFKLRAHKPFIAFEVLAGTF